MHGRREISHYAMLNKIGVPTLNVVAHTDCLILLEDNSASSLYRLGTEDDMSDVRVARLVGKWVSLLHTKGRHHKGLSELPLLDNVNNELDVEKNKQCYVKIRVNGKSILASVMQKHKQY